MPAIFEKRGKPLAGLTSALSERILTKMYQDVLNTARKICPDVKAKVQRNVKHTGIDVLWPADKKSAECLIKAIDKLLQETKTNHLILNKYKADLKKEFKI